MATALAEIDRGSLRQKIESGDQFVLVDALSPMSFALVAPARRDQPDARLGRRSRAAENARLGDRDRRLLRELGLRQLRDRREPPGRAGLPKRPATTSKASATGRRQGCRSRVFTTDKPAGPRAEFHRKLSHTRSKVLPPRARAFIALTAALAVGAVALLLAVTTGRTSRPALVVAVAALIGLEHLFATRLERQAGRARQRRTRRPTSSRSPSSSPVRRWSPRWPWASLSGAS